MLSTSHVALWSCLGCLGCSGATSGAQPHDMSAEQHQAQARVEDEAASAHARQYHPGAAVGRWRCAVGGAGARRDLPPDVCWTSLVNPTARHRREAEEHRRHAAEHRAASSALTEAEARACIGISPGDRDMSPFEHREDITSVAPLVLAEAHARTRLPAERILGAAVTFRAVEGMTAEWLQRLVDCHLARNASLGHEVPEMPACPLVPRGVEAEVTSAGNGFVVSVRSSDPRVAAKIIERAKRTVAPEAVSRPIEVER